MLEDMRSTYCGKISFLSEESAMSTKKLLESKFPSAKFGASNIRWSSNPPQVQFTIISSPKAYQAIDIMLPFGCDTSYIDKTNTFYRGLNADSISGNVEMLEVKNGIETKINIHDIVGIESDGISFSSDDTEEPCHIDNIFDIGNEWARSALPKIENIDSLKIEQGIDHRISKAEPKQKPPMRSRASLFLKSI